MKARQQVSRNSLAGPSLFGRTRGIALGTVEQVAANTGLLIEIRNLVPSSVTNSDPFASAHRFRERSRLLWADTTDLPVSAFGLLADPIGETVLDGNLSSKLDCHVLDITFQPGVTDAEGEMAGQALELAGFPGITCRSGFRYRFASDFDPELKPVVEEALGNHIIHRFAWDGSPAFGSQSKALDTEVRIIEVTGLDSDKLPAVSADFGLALNTSEMITIRDYFRSEGREPTDVELQSIALAWSEHCSHKTFKSFIRHFDGFQTHMIGNLLADHIVEPSLALKKPWLRSAFTDNAGIIAFDESTDLSVKVETHNHPTALDPYGGAHTGVGGVIRDILAVSAEPIANMDVLCFGPMNLDARELPAGTKHPRAVFKGVVAGIADYGNNMGIPTVGGAVCFDPGYTTNPLVFCGTVGIAPRGSHPTQPSTGDLIVVIGGRTGRDGLGGATMSSAALAGDGAQRSAVQIGNPIVEKCVRDALPHLRDERLYNAITDCGAGGLCSAVGEMGAKLGFECDLEGVQLKYQGLSPWEIWLSEAQERMVLSVPAINVSRVRELCHHFGVDMTVIGRFSSDGRMRLRFDGEAVADLDLSFLHGGCPLPERESVWTGAKSQTGPSTETNCTRRLLDLLASPNIASKESVIRRFDHEVGGRTVVKPLTSGSGPSDAAVLKPLQDSWRGVVIAHGIGRLNLEPRTMALAAADEALRNLVAVGGSIDHAALLDNFSWGEVESAEGLGTLVEAVAGCRDAVQLYETPFISGKDSLRNCRQIGSKTHSIPGTLLITAVGIVEDIRTCITSRLVGVGSRVYVVGPVPGACARDAFSAAKKSAPQVMRALSGSIRDRLVSSAHDVSEGGIAVALAEMALSGHIGLEVDATSLGSTPASAIFSEGLSCFICEVIEDKAADFEGRFAGMPLARIGTTTARSSVRISFENSVAVDISNAEADKVWRTPLDPVSEPELRQVEGSRAPAVTTSAPTLKSAPKALVLQAPGINCDVETVEATRQAGGQSEIVHISSLLDRSIRMDDFAALVIPGGFAYGDHLGAGLLLAGQLRAQFADDLDHFVASGRPVVGICNGFQVLARLGLLGQVSLVANQQGRFECRWVGLRANRSISAFFDGLDEFELPIAHGEGRVVVADGVANDVVGRSPLRYTQNPNGSFDNIAALCSAHGNVLGMMPHPERFVLPEQHPNRSLSPGAGPAGLRIFQNIMHIAESA